MKLLSLDFDECSDDVEKARFTSDRSLMDFDAVIWDPGASVDHVSIYSASNYNGYPAVNDHVSARLLASAKRRRADFEHFLASGRSLVVIGRPPGKIWVATGDTTHSGTGRNQKTTRLVEEFNILETLPVDLSMRPSSGENISLTAGGRFADFWAANRQILRYEAILGSSMATTLTVEGTDMAVGAMYESSTGGLLLVIPPPTLPVVEDDDGELVFEESAAGAFTETLSSLIGRLSAARSAEPTPDWAQRLLLPGESELRHRVVAKEIAIEEARGELSGFERDLDAAQSLKDLFTATGQQLENAVRSALEELGGVVTEPPPGRDDWIVNFPAGPSVVEVKGRRKSAAEADSAQLEKWVSRYYEEETVVPKAILVVNAFRTRPLSERSQPAFPPQMLEYAEKRDHCLITGSQLLVLVLRVRSGDLSIDDVQNLLLSTVGVLDMHLEWADLLEPIIDEEAAPS